MNTSQLSEKDFQIIKQLGSGSFGTVHMAKNRSDNKIYAIKSVQLSQMSQKEKESALNQVRLLASINVPYVIGYHGAFFDANKKCLCIAMEYADGGDLQAKITQQKDTTEEGFEEEYVWKVAYEIFSGLKILHKNNIIHRDIKSANIFFSKGIAKLGDLNVSKFAEQGMCSTQTGTPYYTSPQIWKGDQYTAKCDIWSTGCLLYEMCTLNHPFKGRDFPTLYRKVIVGNYDPISAKYSQQLHDLIRMCLTVDDYMRPSADKLLQTTVLSGMDANMEKFDNKGEVNLIDPIKCPRVLKFLNTKLPKPVRIGDTNKKTVNFSIKKENERSQVPAFKITKQSSMRKIRSQKVLPNPDELGKLNLSRVESKKQIKLPSLDITEQNTSLIIPENTPKVKEVISVLQPPTSPLNFSQKKLRVGSSIKRLPSRKNIVIIDESKNQENTSLEKRQCPFSPVVKNCCMIMKINNGSRVLLTQSGKKIVSPKDVEEKENKRVNV